MRTYGVPCGRRASHADAREVGRTDSFNSFIQSNEFDSFNESKRSTTIESNRKRCVDVESTKIMDRDGR